MAVDATLDLERLLAPLAGDRATGVSLQDGDSSGLAFADLRAAFNKARTAERKVEQARYLPEGDPAAQVDPPAWDEVEKSAVELLAEQSKDLWVAAWLTEALFRRNGFSGLRDGLRLARRLCEEYWDDLYPLPEEQYGYGDRIIHLGQLLSNEKLLRIPILQAPLTQDRGFSALDYQGAGELEGLKTSRPDTYEQRKSAGDVTLDDIQADAKHTSLEYFRGLADAIGECLEELDRLGPVLEERCAADPKFAVPPPSHTALREALVTCQDVVRAIAPAAFATEPTPGENEEFDAPEGQPASAVAGRISAPGAVSSREQAFRLLEQVARFFEETEPQSFIPFSLRQIVRRGSLALPDLLAELIADDAARHDFARLTGVPDLEENREHSE